MRRVLAWIGNIRIPRPRTVSLPAVICAVLLASSAQLPAQVESQKSGLPERSILEKLNVPSVQDGNIPLSATLEPEKYYVGPSDVISVNLWMSPPTILRLEVTPEGTLIIPSVGEVRVSEMLLSRAKETILTAVKKRYLNIEATVTLVRPRNIIVTVKGKVLHEGHYTMRATDRADIAIHQANTPLRIEENKDLEEILKDMSLRHVVIRHRDASQSRVDFVKFLATKADDLNPYLREGDVVVVPERDETKGVFGVYGEVNMPGRFEYVEGDLLSDMIGIAQGLTERSRHDSVEFTRLSPDGRSMEVTYFNLPDLAAGSPTDIPIEPGDRLVVRPKTELRADYRVHIEGEVLYPGTYPITKDRTRISDVIRQAGGFTEFAALGSAELSRRSVQPQEVEIDRLMSLRGGVSQEDSLDYIRETNLRLRKEIVNVDFTALFRRGDSTQDVLLLDEDVIKIPSVKRTVYVFGQIVSPGHIPFVEGADPSYYIEKAGGFTDRARTEDIRIIKSKTKQWLAADETEMEEGDYIWIPRDPDRPFSYYMTSVSQAAGILSVIVGMAAVIVSVSK